VKYEARQGETEGSLVLLYEPPSRIIRHHAWPNTETWNIVTLTAVQGGTVVRVEESAILRGGWHRLLFPRQMKGWAQEILREYARDAGQPHPRIVPDGSPALAFTPFTDRAARAVPLDHPVAARSLAGKPALRSKDSGTHPKPLPVVSRPADTSAEELPRLGEYVYVDELPVLITAVKPTYPDIARDASVDGTVMVQALVGKDGHVKDAKVVKSIPMLDASALTAVKQFVFKPALANNRPVAVWVAVPIRFSLN
jgi:protein TonB